MLDQSRRQRHLASVSAKFRKFEAVQGHPRSSILVSIESSHTTFYQSLIVTLAVSATVFKILTHKARKSLNLYTPPFFEAPFGGTPENFVMKFGVRKLESRGYQMVQKSWCFLRFDTIPARNGWTDRQTDTLRSLLPVLAQRRAGKNDDIHSHNIRQCSFVQSKLGLYRISALAPAGIKHFFQMWQKSGSGKNPTRAGQFCRI